MQYTIKLKMEKTKCIASLGVAGGHSLASRSPFVFLSLFLASFSLCGLILLLRCRRWVIFGFRLGMSNLTRAWPRSETHTGSATWATFRGFFPLNIIKSFLAKGELGRCCQWTIIYFSGLLWGRDRKRSGGDNMTLGQASQAVLGISPYPY